MSGSLPLLLGASPAPLFGNAWLALAACLVLVAALMAAVVIAGRWLAATHPDPAPAAAAPGAVAAPTTAQASPKAELAAVISASVVVALGERAKVVAVKPLTPPAPSVEMLMQQWSIEGRRQIYSSHQIR